MRKMGDSADMKHEKFKMVIMGTALCMSMLFLSACGTLVGDPQDQNIAEDITKEDEEEVNDETLSEEENITYPVYEVESIDNLQLDNKEFHIENYYIKNQSNNLNRYYIDSHNVLWGYGRNDYGQLGNGEQNSLGDYVMTLQKIAENVVHVDANQYFTIYLTEKGELYGIGANLNGIMGMEITEDYAFQMQQFPFRASLNLSKRSEKKWAFPRWNSPPTILLTKCTRMLRPSPSTRCA